MKKSLLIILIAILSLSKLHAQGDLLKAAKAVKPAPGYENIHVEKLFSDQHASTFVVFVKKRVRLHLHKVHSELVYVLKGKGTMRLGEDRFPVKKGDVVFIPRNTPHAVTVKGGPMKVLSVQAPEFKGKDRIFLKE